MQWIKGDVCSAFADLPDLRVRANEYLALFKRRDRLLDVLDKASKAPRDREAFDKFAERCSECGSQMIWGAKQYAFKVDGEWQSDNRLVWGNFCEQAFCPVCAKKKSVRLSRMLNELMERLDQQNYQFYHMVLSDKNCLLKDLKKTIEHYNKSFSRFAHSTLNPLYDGYFVSLEYTLKFENGVVLVHPHFHVLLAISQEKFLSGKSFVSWEWLRKRWARSLLIKQVDDLEKPKQLKRDKDYEYLPFLSIYKVKKGGGQIFSELTKYLTDFDKLIDVLIDHPDKFSFADFYDSFFSKKLHRGSGVLAFRQNNIHFVQLPSSQLPEYNPEVFAFSLLSEDRSRLELRGVISENDIIRVDVETGEQIAPVKSVISSYVCHQAYQYGFKFNRKRKMDLPAWWNDISIEPPDPRSNSSPPSLSVYEQLSFFDFET